MVPLETELMAANGQRGNLQCRGKKSGRACRYSWIATVHVPSNDGIQVGTGDGR